MNHCVDIEPIVILFYFQVYFGGAENVAFFTFGLLQLKTFFRAVHRDVGSAIQKPGRPCRYHRRHAPPPDSGTATRSIFKPMASSCASLPFSHVTERLMRWKVIVAVALHPYRNMPAIPIRENIAGVLKVKLQLRGAALYVNGFQESRGIVLFGIDSKTFGIYVMLFYQRGNKFFEVRLLGRAG
jgi:hypothetical protein